MPPGLSPRLAGGIVDALPFTPESRVLEIGCGTGAAARHVAAESFVLEPGERPFGLVLAVRVGTVAGAGRRGAARRRDLASERIAP